MLLKYNLSSEVTDLVATDIKWILSPKTINLTADHLYQFNSSVVAKGDPFILTVNLDPLYTLRYLTISSENSFTIKINNSFQLLTNLFTIDVGPNRRGFTGLTDIQQVTLTNPTGSSGLVGAQFTNPPTIEIKYILVLEKI